MNNGKKSALVAGLDIGSGRVTCLVGARDEASGVVKVLGGANIACRGINAGVVINTLETTSAVARAIRLAEEQAGSAVSSAWLGLRGRHIQSFNNHGACDIAPASRVITANDVNAALANASDFPLASDRKILHVLPRTFILDGQCQTRNPVGSSAVTLGVDAHLVTLSKAHLNNILKTMPHERIGKVVPMFGLLALGELLLTPEERGRGCVLIDLGGQSASVAAYYEGTIMYSAEIPYGSDLITRDLAIGLGTSFAIAEKVKIAHGAADPSCITADVDVEVRGDAGQVPLHVKTRAIANMIGPRLEEIFAMVNESLHNSGYVDLVLPGNIILAGGGSLLQGVADAIQKHMGFRVRAGAARPDLVQAEEQWLSPAYSTALGLLYCSNTPPCGVTLD